MFWSDNRAAAVREIRELFVRFEKDLTASVNQAVKVGFLEHKEDFGCCQDRGCCQNKGCCAEDKWDWLPEGWQVQPQVWREYIASNKEEITEFFRGRGIDLG